MVVRRCVFPERCVFAAFVSATTAGGAARRGRIQRSLSDRGAWRELTRRRHVRGAVSRKASLKTTVPGVCRRRQRGSGGSGGVFYWTPYLLLSFRPRAKAKQNGCRWRQSIGVPGAGDIYARVVHSCYISQEKYNAAAGALEAPRAHTSYARRCDVLAISHKDCRRQFAPGRQQDTHCCPTRWATRVRPEPGWR